MCAKYIDIDSGTHTLSTNTTWTENIKNEKKKNVRGEKRVQVTEQLRIKAETEIKSSTKNGKIANERNV